MTASYVRYLRASERPDLAKLGQVCLRQVYHVAPEDKLRLIITGFAWTPKTTTTKDI